MPSPSYVPIRPASHPERPDMRDPERQQRLLDQAREHLKKHEVVKKMFDEFDLDVDEIDLVPMGFKPMDVSARTDHGILWFNEAMLDGSFEDNLHYGVHELEHYCQQTTGDKPTEGSSDGDYLGNQEEVDAFQRQVEYMAGKEGKDHAESYVDQVLDHHDETGKQREDRKADLMNNVD